MSFRVVPDTNVLITSRKSPTPTSPTRELFERWIRGEFTLLYSLDTIVEYLCKFRELGLDPLEARLLLTEIAAIGELVSISTFHEQFYPKDPEDIAFLLCATNGEASHLVTYDSDFDPVKSRYLFIVCTPLEFLRQLRNY